MHIDQQTSETDSLMRTDADWHFKKLRDLYGSIGAMGKPRPADIDRLCEFFEDGIFYFDGYFSVVRTTAGIASVLLKE